MLWGILIPARLVFGMAQGNFHYEMEMVAALVIAYATLRRRIPWLVFIVGLPTFLVLQPLKATLRSAVWQEGSMGESKEVSESEKLDALASTVSLVPEIVKAASVEDLIGLASLRLADIMVFVVEVSQTPKNIPYWNGETYYPLLVAPIPRLIYPDKTIEDVNNTFGHRYGLLSPGDWTTGILITQTAEFYGNFGVLGLIVGSFLIGAIYRAINEMFLYKGCTLGSLVGGAYLFTHFMNIEEAASAVFGSIYLYLLIIAAFHYGIRLMEMVVVAVQVRREPMMYMPF